MGEKQTHTRLFVLWAVRSLIRLIYGL